MKAAQLHLLAWASSRFPATGHIPYKPSFPRYPGQTREQWFTVRQQEIAPLTPCSFCRESVKRAINHLKQFSAATQ